MHLGRLGAVIGGIGSLSAPEERAAARELEQLGYETLWIAEGASTRESLVHAALLLGWTERVTIATSITSIWGRDPAAAANASRALAEAYPGRFVLGLGVSHARVVSGRGHAYERPYTAMKAYLDDLDAAPYLPPPPAAPVPRLLAALAPRMLRLSAERANGTQTSLMPPHHTAWARGIVGPEATIAVKQSLIVGENGQAYEVGRSYLAPYLGLENYRAAWLRGSDLDEGDFADGGSDRLVDLVFGRPGARALEERVQAHFDAGADHVAVGAQSASVTELEGLRRLADLLL